jgi:hypothetical protein
MFYRSYGMLLVIVAVLIVHQRPSHQFPYALSVAGLVLLIDFPLRWLGNKVPWREYDVDLWAISPYRGSHVFFIPTWLLGGAALGIAGACIISPGFQAMLEKPNLFKREPDVQPPPVPVPGTEATTGKLDMEIEEIAPFNGETFQFTYFNRTGEKFVKMDEVVRFKTDTNPNGQSSAPIAGLEIGERRANRLPFAGKYLWIRVEAKARTKEGREFTIEREWMR